MQRVTIEDVAREAGVSRQTVSRAINAKGDISEETRERVLTVVQRLGYRPNRLAQSMITQRTYTIGMEVVDITNPVFAEIVKGAQDIAAERGYNIFLTNSNDDPAIAVQALTTLVTHGVDGLIAMFPNASDAEILAFADRYRPLVLINRTIEHPSISTVAVDIYRGAVMAVEHLLERGHTAIGMVDNLSRVYSNKRRLIAYQDTLRRHGVSFNPDWIVNAPPTLEGGYQATIALLTAYPELTAIFGYNDLMSIGALRACQDVGRCVPQECAVVSFDDIALASLVTPSLSTIGYDKYALGQQAMLRLLDMIEMPQEEFSLLTMPLRLVARESTNGLVSNPTSGYKNGVSS